MNDHPSTTLRILGETRARKALWVASHLPSAPAQMALYFP